MPAVNALTSPKTPKEPKTGYNFFCELERPKLLVAFPGAKPADISKMLGEAWKKLNRPEDRAPFEAQAQADRERFAAECAKAGIDPMHRHKRKVAGADSAAASANSQQQLASTCPAPAMRAVDIYATASRGFYTLGSDPASVARFETLPVDEREGYEAAARADARRFAREKAELDRAAAAEAVAATTFVSASTTPYRAAIQAVASTPGEVLPTAVAVEVEEEGGVEYVEALDVAPLPGQSLVPVVDHILD